jgi:hypothetical protein
MKVIMLVDPNFLFTKGEIYIIQQSLKFIQEANLGNNPLVKIDLAAHEIDDLQSILDKCEEIL